MRRLVYFLAALFVTATLVGCGGDKDRGQNRGYDKPQAPEQNK